MTASDAFNPRTMLWAVLASMMAAAGFFLLSTYAPDFQMAGAGGATPLSKSAVGLAGVVELLGLVGEEPVMARSDADLDIDALLIVPLSTTTPKADLEKLIQRRANKTTMFILPKWVVTPMPGKPGWDMRIAHTRAAELDVVLRQIADSYVRWSPEKLDRLDLAGMHVAAPEQTQWIVDSDPYLAVGPGRAMITKIDGEPHYVLADPDMLDNLGMADRDRAAAMLRVLRALKPDADPVMFDLTLYGAGHRRSLQKLLVEPPFLALTLALLATGALALAHGFVRFGPPAAEIRALAFGKYALSDTTARLFRRAGRLGTLGGRYAALMRMRAPQILGAPSSLAAADVEPWLDRLDREDGLRFSDLAANVAEATTEPELQNRAQVLYDWIQRRTRDR